jgi:hypothetical protein
MKFTSCAAWHISGAHGSNQQIRYPLCLVLSKAAGLDLAIPPLAKSAKDGAPVDGGGDRDRKRVHSTQGIADDSVAAESASSWVNSS